MRAQRIKLNLVPGGVIPVVYVSQYDVGRPLEFALYDGPAVATLEAGTTIDIRATKPDGHGFAYACTWTNNVVSFSTTRQMTIVSGSIECELRLKKDSADIGTANFILEIENTALKDDTDMSGSELPIFLNLGRSYAEQAANSATAAANSATAAANSATAAANSATAAAEIKEDIEQMSIPIINRINAIEALVNILLGNVFLTTENGDNIVTQNDEKLIINY